MILSRIGCPHWITAVLDTPAKVAAYARLPHVALIVGGPCTRAGAMALGIALLPPAMPPTNPTLPLYQSPSPVADTFGPASPQGSALWTIPPDTRAWRDDEGEERSGVNPFSRVVMLRGSFHDDDRAAVAAPEPPILGVFALVALYLGCCKLWKGGRR